jgi:hypothetical protein
LERTHPGVNSSVADRASLVVRVEDVRSAETDQGHAGVNVLPVVIGVGDVELAGVLVAVAVAVADERGLVVVVEDGVAVEKKETSQLTWLTMRGTQEIHNMSLT